MINFDYKRIVEISFSQFAKFITVGVLNTVVGYVIYAGLIISDFSTANALILTYVIAVPFNFLTTGKLVFDSKHLEPLVRFILSYVVIFTINWVLLHLLINFGIGRLIAQAITLPFIAILSFLIFKYTVFRRV